MATAALTGCTKSSTPAASSAASSAASPDPVERKLQELAGGGASDCGHFKTQTLAQIKPGSDCAMQAAQNKRPFYIAYEMPGLTVGVAGNSEGKMFAIQTETAAQPGATAEVKSAPCPAPLRVAESGRVTCIAPGSMGMSTGGSSHGGMTMPPAGTPNPHAGKTPPP